MGHFRWGLMDVDVSRGHCTLGGGMKKVGGSVGVHRR